MQKLRNRFRSSSHPPTGPPVLAIDTEENETKLHSPRGSLNRLKRWFPGSRAVIFCGGIALGVFLFFAGITLLFDTYRLLMPQCTYVYDRLCNGHGDCVRGRCVCDSLFSGSACTETQILGYDPVDDSVCFRNGYVMNPFISAPVNCTDGWLTEPCNNYVTFVRNQILNADGDLLATYPDSYTVPDCFCFPGYGGLACNATSCPLDENGFICGGNGNTSVGLISNYTRAGNGCQCSSLVSFYQSPYSSYFSEATRVRFFTEFYEAFNSLYCGHIVNVTTDVVLAYTLVSDYRCYCANDWVGPVCNQGKCPLNKQTNAICWGNGHPLLGYGKIENYTAKSYQGRTCPIECFNEDFQRCSGALENTKCVYNQGNTPYFKEGTWCANPLVCPRSTPIRCPSGTCAPIPEPQSIQCFLGYETGSIDLQQLQASVDFYSCPNITDRYTLADCLRNTTPIEGITGYAPEGGFYVLNASVVINLVRDSSLIYFQMVTNQTEAYVETWDGQILTKEDDGFFAGLFVYDESQIWGDPIPRTFLISPFGGGGGDGEQFLYSVNSMPWNYSGATSFNESFRSVRIYTPGTELSFVFVAEGSRLVTLEFDEDLARERGLLIQTYQNTNLTFDSFFLDPAGVETVTPLLTAYGSPEVFAFYWDEEADQVRNLQGGVYLCYDLNDLGDPVPVTQEMTCSTNFSDFLPLLDSYIFSWETDLIVSTAATIAPITEPITLDYYQLNISATERTRSFTIGWGQSVSAEPILVQNLVFLTLTEGIWFPCACYRPVGSVNQTALFSALIDPGPTFLYDEFFPPSVGDYALGIRFLEGSNSFLAGQIVGVSEAAQTLTIQTLKNSSIPAEAFYYNNSRRLERLDIIRGAPDCVTADAPFRCPDGSCSRGEAFLIDVPTSCNCTYESPISRCNCTDEMRKAWSCQCNLAIPICQCGFPTTHDFEQALLEKTLNLVTRGCSCIFYDPSAEDLINGTTLIDANLSSTATVDFDVQQVLQFVHLTLTEPITEDGLLIYGSSFLFVNVSLPISFQLSANDSMPAEIDITLFLDPDIAFSTLTFELVDETILIETIVLVFSLNGFSLGQIDPAPSFTASSNAANASNVNLIDSSYWAPSDDIRDYPTWIRMDLSHRYYLDYCRVVFEQAGYNVSVEIQIPFRVYLQASNDLIDWYTIGSWEVYAAPGSWIEKTMDMRAIMSSFPNRAFSSFRLITPQGTFNVRLWELYAYQRCTCDDDSILVLNLTTLDGLPTIESELETISFFEENLNASLACSCLNNCTIMGIDVTSNGVCNDAIYQGFRMGVPKTLQIGESVVTNYTALGYVDFLYTENLTGSVGAVQFIFENETFLDNTALFDFYNLTVNFNVPVTPNNSAQIIFVNGSDYGLISILALLNPPTLSYWEFDTFIVNTDVYEYGWQDYIATGLVCSPGTDCTDCGPSNRLPVLMEGYTCFLTDYQSQIATALVNQSVIFNKTYVVQNLTQVTGPWQAYYQNIELNRTLSKVRALDCAYQVCPTIEEPVMCLNGRCVKYRWMCQDVVNYTCPATGCVELIGVSSLPTYRCACAPGFSGDACQFGQCKPSTPNFPISSAQHTPPAQECSCGGPPPLRLKPPVLNILQFGTVDYTTEQIVTLNDHQRAGCGPISSVDIGYHCVLPSFAPWGTALRRRVLLRTTNQKSAPEQLIYTTCPFLRKDPYGQLLLLDEDIASRNPYTRAITWKTYTDPITGDPLSVQWSNIASYDDAPYRCPQNGQCVSNPVDCIQSSLLFTLCNGRGTCNSDGTCDCDPRWRTYTINSAMSAYISYPYYSQDGITNPTIWALNFNWKHFPQSQCAARNCQDDTLYGQGTCVIPETCFPGTPSIQFADKFQLCPAGTRGYNLCAPSYLDCIAGVALEQPMPCAGKGIQRIKDFTGEYYCACGSPISSRVNITNVAQITELRPNGWGGPNCDVYYDPNAATAPLIYSTWNPELNEPWRSLVTGVLLPGVWIKGGAIVGPRPEDRKYWNQCCNGYERLEYCPYVACKVEPGIQCLTPQACLAYRQTAPLIFICNGHGSALADNSCECDTDIENGSGYTFDLTQFSVKGCYRYVQCPVYTPTGKACNFIDGCTAPAEWRHPMPYDLYYEQQNFTCGLRGIGEIDSQTILEEISVNVFNFDRQFLQGLATIATQVLDAETALAGCICVYPNDTISDKCCMVENGKEYQYERNFAAPYLLEPLIPVDEQDQVLVDGILPGYPGDEETSHLYPVGSIIKLYLDNDNQTTSIAAIRAWTIAQEGAILYFTDGDGNSICRGEWPLQTNWFASLFYWLLGSDTATGVTGQAAYCGPVYKCVDSAQFPRYAEFCAARPSSEQCLFYKKQYCEEVLGDVFWPPDESGDRQKYQGCIRVGRDSDGCTCCHQDLSQTYAQIPADGQILVHVLGADIYIGELQFYGLTNTSLDLPDGLLEYLDNQTFKSLGCHDERYLTQYLGADHSYYVAFRNKTTYYPAQDLCRATGGFLAIGDNANNLSDVSALKNFCGNKFTPGTTCLVGAINPYTNSSSIPRDQLFNITCTFYGCYAKSLLRSINDLYYFSTNATGQQYTSPFYTNQMAIEGMVVPPINDDPIASDVGCKTQQAPANSGIPRKIICATQSVNPLGYRNLLSAPFNDWFGINQNAQPEIDRTSSYLMPWLYGTTAGVVKPITDEEGTCFIQFLKAPLTPGEPIEMTFRMTFWNGPFGLKQITEFTGPEGKSVWGWNLRYGQEIYLPEMSFYNGNGLKTPFFLNEATSITFSPPNCGKLNMYGSSSHSRAPYWVKGSSEEFQPPYCPAGSSYCFQETSCGLGKGSGQYAFITGANSQYQTYQSKINPQYRVFQPEQYLHAQCDPGSNLSPYVRVYPQESCLYYGMVRFQSQLLTSGTIGINRVQGFRENPWMPAFLNIWMTHLITPSGTDKSSCDTAFGIGTVPLYGAPNLRTGANPAWFNGGPGYAETAWSNAIQPFGYVTECRHCLKAIQSNYLWNELFYTDTTWKSSFQGPANAISLIINGAAPIKLPLLQVTQVPIYVHQIVYIQNYTLIPNPLVPWDLDNCLAVDAGGAKTVSCRYTAYNYICQYDWVKYAIVTGYQCPLCGPSTRSGGAPLAGVSCFDDNDLANATAHPLEHEIAAAYVAGTLDLLAATINPGATQLLDFGNTSVIWGFASAWEAWAADYSSRAATLSRNVIASQNWCDMSLTANFPVDCGLQVDPYSNLELRYCATSVEYCNLNVEIPTNAPLFNETPPVLNPVSEALVYVDPTCGFNVKLPLYVITEGKYGASQTDVAINTQILSSLEGTGLQVLVLNNQSALWNSGKSNTGFKFEWNETGSVYGTYLLDPCPSPCTDPYMDIFIYPLSPFYEFPTTYLTQRVNLTVGVLSSFLVNFTVTEADTGEFEASDGNDYPNVTFRGVGYLLGEGLPILSAISLFNPLITTEASRTQCQTRNVSNYLDSLYRIEVTAPNRKCIITAADQLLHPDTPLGGCDCDLSTTGEDCGAPAVIGPFGKEACGGYGDNAKSVLAPDGQIYTTGSGAKAGAYVWGDNNMDCKTINVGRALYTLLMDAIYDYPSVYVASIPTRGESVFLGLQTPVGAEYTYDEAKIECEAAARQDLPYFYSVDEANQLAFQTINRWPVFLSVNSTGATAGTWPWISSITDTYLIRDNAGTFNGVTGSCNPATRACRAINFNNYAFSGTLSTSGDAFLIDGNSVTINAAAGGTLTWSPLSDLAILVYVFGDASGAANIVCSFGTTCTSTVVGGADSKWECRCPNRVIEYDAGNYAEIQIFNARDLARAITYTYYN